MMHALDLVRVFFGMITALGGGMIVVIMFHYYRLVKRGHNIQLPSHIFLIGTSYVLFAAYIIGDQASRHDTPLTWRLPLAMTGAVIGVPALAAILKNVQDRDK